jgi:hypothetical protein
VQIGPLVISLLSMFSNYSSTVGDGEGGPKLLYILEEEYWEDEDGDGDTSAASKKGAVTMGVIVVKQITSASNAGVHISGMQSHALHCRSATVHK